MNPQPPQPRVALVHDWLTGMRGGEKVLAELCRLLPTADLLTLIHVPGATCPVIENRRIRASWLSRLPGVRNYYRHLLPLMPGAIESLDASAYDLIVSTSHCVAKGVGGQHAGQLHVCYCFTPMRYIWAVQDDYKRRGGATALALRAFGPRLRKWDRASANKVKLFLADSACVAGRIQQAYDRQADVLYPPVDVDYFTPDGRRREDFYLVVSAMAPYKRVEQAIAATAKLNRPLKIIGTGQEYDRLHRSAPPNAEFLGWCDDATVRDHYRTCRALLFPQLEDFGIVPLEAMACGAPVIAFGGGGATETVLDASDPGVAAPTGLLYETQTPEALAATIVQFEGLASRFDQATLRAWAERFSPRRFVDGFKRAVEPLLAQRGWGAPWRTT